MKRELECRQAQIMEIMEKLDRFLAAPEAPNLVALGELRVANQNMLTEHLAFKETMYRRLRGFGIGHVDRHVGRSRSATMALHVAYRFHVVDWHAETIARDWPSYVSAARGIIARFCLLIETDRVHLYPLLDQLLGDAAASPNSAVEPGATALGRALERAGSLREVA